MVARWMRIAGDDSIARPALRTARGRGAAPPICIGPQPALSGADVYGLFTLSIFLTRWSLMSLHPLSTFATLTALAATIALAACSSTSGPELRASKPVIHVSSARTASDVSSCLERMLPSVETTRANGSTELVVGPNAWLVTLTPSGYGSIVKVQKSEGEYSGLPEPELRFDIARCTT